MRTQSKRFVIVCAGLLAPSLAALPAFGDVTATKVGNPTWAPVDFHTFSAPLGTPPNFPEFAQTEAALLSPPNHVHVSGLGIGPGAAHAGPYTHEFADGVASAGFVDKSSFTPSEFSLPLGVWSVWMIVPTDGAPTGSSPDFASGPIIPNSLFPISVAGTAFRNGALFDPDLGTFSRKSLASLNPPFLVDGDSHFPIFYADAVDFGPAGTNPLGNYDYQVLMRDQLGNGWDIHDQFSVVPEPSSAMLIGVGGCGLMLRRRRLA